MKITHLLYSAVFLLTVSLTKAQDFFSASNERSLNADSKNRTVQPEKYLTYKLDVGNLKNYFNTVPELRDNDSKDNARIIILPMPNGTKAKFKIWKSSVMDNELAAKFPGIVTFTGQGIDDAYATVKLDFTDLGFHAQIKSVVTGDLYIDPYAKGDINNYIVYKKDDLINNKTRSCGVKDDLQAEKKKRTKKRYSKCR
ncbi:hypothetical protein AB4Y90_06280 [Chryseobacterium sp. 2TAF14]|uniref:hypothetical protein n=1 Tax=Chryseobacterium sp. 2TAF14 TaxID=3233007 RepID=UPI003F929861